MSVEGDVARALEAARAFTDAGETVAGILPTEPGAGSRVYVVAYERGEERRWLALDRAGNAVTDRTLVRDAVSIAALCELAEESAGGGDLGELRTRLVELRLTENPEGIEEAEIAAAELQETILEPPRVASVAYLDAVGAAARRLEHALGEVAASPFAEAMKSAIAAAEELAGDVEATYKRPLT